MEKNFLCCPPCPPAFDGEGGDGDEDLLLPAALPGLCFGLVLLAHFAVTSSWDGNIGLCSHNVAPAGAVVYFRDIHQLKKGDTLSYKTALGEREYKVSEVKEIPQDDWSALSRTEDNRLTLVTCITGKPTMRLLVQAIEG